jgi:hypothetical protein
LLFKLQGETDITDSLKELNAIRQSHLINYFNKLVDVIVRGLQHRKISPFGEYGIVNYFKRTAFQHRGSPHAHLLIWLGNDPLEKTS